MNQSPLRYPGGKTRACKILDEIVCQQFDISAFDRIISPFFGGGSFEFYLQNKYHLRIIANDKFTPLANFWRTCKTNQVELVAELEKKIDRISKTEFLEYRAQIMEELQQLEQSIMYFIINRCSFSGATLSGGFSQDASKNRFTLSSIEKIARLRQLSEKTINGHFINLIKAEDIELSDVMSKERIREIESYFEDYNESSLTPLKEKLGDVVSWEELKLYRASTII